MSNNKIINGIKSAATKASFKIKKHSPTILLITGITGAVGGVVAACIATTKVKTIIDSHKEQLTAVRETLADESKAEIYSAEDGKKDRAIIYIQTGIKLVGLYAPAAAIEAGAIVCLLASHNILRKRNAALAAAYATVENGFKKYRDRVIERFGQGVDDELKFGVKAKQIEEIVKDPDTGKEKKVKKTVKPAGGDLGGSPYAILFDEDTSEVYEADREYNLMHLRAEQQYANDRLKARGYLYLNEVYERLGIDGSKMGQVVGWVYDPNNPDYDNFVDFGIREIDIEDVLGVSPQILLDFNVQGNILDLMP